MADPADVYVIPSLPGYWIRPSDGAIINVRIGKVRAPRRRKGRNCLVHSIGRTSRTVQSLIKEATANGAQPATQYDLGLDLAALIDYGGCMSWPPNRLSPGANPNPVLPRITFAIVDYDLHNSGRVCEVVTFKDMPTARAWLDGYWHCRPSRTTVWQCGPEP